LLTSGHLSFLHPVVVGGGACRGGLLQRGGRWRGRIPGVVHRWPRDAEWRSCAGYGPLPRAWVQLPVCISTGGLPLMILLYGCVRVSSGGHPRTVTACRGRPQVDASGQLCAGFLQCGLFVKMCAVECVLLLGGVCRWCGVAACSVWSVAVCAWGSPSSTSVSTSCLSRPVLPRRLWRVVRWVGFLLDMIGGVESALWEGCYPASALAMGSV